MNIESGFSVSQDLLDRCHERAPVYDRENRFFQEDFDELKDAGYLLMDLVAWIIRMSNHGVFQHWG